MNFLSSIAKVLVTPLVIILHLAGYSLLPTAQLDTLQKQNLGAYAFSGGGTYRLKSSIGSTDSSITLSSFKEPVSNIAYTMAYLGSAIEYGTIDPQTASSKEFVSFTGITQNADGTATLSGVSRGLSFSTPYTASSTLRQSHAGQSIFILSNTPAHYNEFAIKRNAESITGVWTFASTSQPVYDGTGTITNPLSLIHKSYADALAFQGVATATEESISPRPGAVVLATLSQQSAGTASTTSGAPLVLLSRNATSTCSGTSVNRVLVLGSGGSIDPNCIGLSGNYTWTGLHIFNSSTTTLNATTSIAASSGNRLVLNSLPYTFPAVRGASSTVLMEDGTGRTLWSNSFSRLLDASTTVGQITSTASTTIYSYLLAGNSLGIGNVVHGVIPYSNASIGAWTTVDISYGTASTTQFITCVNCPTGTSGNLEFWLSGNGATNLQKMNWLMDTSSTSARTGKSGNPNQDSTGAQKITVIISSNGGAITFDQAILDLLVR